MSSGSYGNNGDPEEGLGDRPIHMGAWEKFQLGWLDFALVLPGQSQTVRLGPAARDTSDTQAAIALLPDREVTIDLGDPHTGPDFFYSDQGNDLDNTMLTAKPAGGTTLTAQVRYEIEQDWDYAYAGYVNAAGSFVSLPTNLSTDTNPNGQNFGHGITGTSNGDWVPLTVDIATVPDGAQIGFRYWTDGAAVEQGFSADVVAVDGTEIPAAAWEFAGFRTTTGTETRQFFNAYIAENRAYVGYDAGLQNGPYNFGDPARPNWAERLPYQDGLLISYWNEQYQDNNVGDHPGAGLILPVDARPQLMYEPTDDEPDNGPTGEIWRSRIQSFDSTFGLQKVDSVTLHDPDSGVADQYGGSAAVPLFDDRKDWYVEAGSRPDADGWAGVDVPKTGTTIRVAAVSASGQTMQIRIN
jgi:immune inhibitor A